MGGKGPRCDRVVVVEHQDPRRDEVAMRGKEMTALIEEDVIGDRLLPNDGDR